MQNKGINNPKNRSPIWLMPKHNSGLLANYLWLEDIFNLDHIEEDALKKQAVKVISKIIYNSLKDTDIGKKLKSIQKRNELNDLKNPEDAPVLWNYIVSEICELDIEWNNILEELENVLTNFASTAALILVSSKLKHCNNNTQTDSNSNMKSVEQLSNTYNGGNIQDIRKVDIKEFHKLGFKNKIINGEKVLEWNGKDNDH